jgi:hypothetical protein
MSIKMSVCKVQYAKEYEMVLKIGSWGFLISKDIANVMYGGQQTPKL